MIRPLESNRRPFWFQAGWFRSSITTQIRFQRRFRVDDRNFDLILIKVYQFWSNFDQKIDQSQFKDRKSQFKDRKSQLNDLKYQLNDRKSLFISKKLIEFYRFRLILNINQLFWSYSRPNSYRRDDFDLLGLLFWIKNVD